MKTLKLISILIVLLITTACNSTKEAVATAETVPAPETTETANTPPQRGPQGGQWQQDPERKAKYEAMLSSLNMTEKQREDFDFINKKYRAQMQQMRQNAGDDWQAMRGQMQELRVKQNAELKEVLSNEQFAAYEKWNQENRSGRRGGGDGNRNN